MIDPLFSVADKVVLVSGASRGIGKAIARGFAERQAIVVITGRDEDTLEECAREIAGENGRVHRQVCDVAQSDDLASVVNYTMKEFGRIDTLINVAGVNRRKPAFDVTEEDYDFVMDINLKGAFLLSKLVGKQMVQQGSGSQINIASLNTDRPLTNLMPYAMSKSAMGHMTKLLAMEWGEHGVRVNALAPGFILTDLSKTLWANEVMQEWNKANTPQRRLGQPEDMIGTALFLAAPASSFMTGQVLYVDGGFTAGWNWPIRQTDDA